MRILTAGGGSGGHVTPVVAVLRELKQVHPEAEYRFWCDKRFSAQAKNLMSEAFGDDVRVSTIVAGRFRRYNSVSVWEQLKHPLTIVLPNIIDLVKVVVGVVQSLGRLIIWRPDVVFAKGGFVCLPIGFAAHLLRIPLVIHDSDAHPGLTNRILSRWASAIATGAPLEYYTYPASKSKYVGIPIQSTVQPPTEAEQAALKEKLGFDPGRSLLVVTGGGLGAVRINNAVVAGLPQLLQSTSVALICGKTQYDELRQRLGADTEVFQLHDFINNMLEYMSAADIVVSRAGMTATTELAALARPTILVPNAYLTGGHQVKNARVYSDANAVAVLEESDMENGFLPGVVGELLASGEKREVLAANIHKFAKPDAAADMAAMVLSVVRNATIK
jgi:UDP-N-acetylglucosamine--N-acetylmuramyl-(pentapeptide) pyrophosphoryl-undecaprenol N-acetylglucosamine transferase